MLKYQVKLVYKDAEDERHISTFSVANWEALNKLLQIVSVNGWQMVFVTVSDNEDLNRLHGARALVTYYDLDIALMFMAAKFGMFVPEFTDIYRIYATDFIKSHEERKN